MERLPAPRRTHAGDIRTQFFAEDTKKVQRIVAGSRAGLQEMYSDEALIRTCPEAAIERTGTDARGRSCFARRADSRTHVALLEKLPVVRAYAAAGFCAMLLPRWICARAHAHA